MEILVEIRVTESVDEAPPYKHLMTIERVVSMPELPTRSAWLTFGEEGQQLTFGPTAWKIDWLDTRKCYRVAIDMHFDGRKSEEPLERERLALLQRSWTVRRPSIL